MGKDIQDRKLQSNKISWPNFKDFDRVGLGSGSYWLGHFMELSIPIGFKKILTQDILNQKLLNFNMILSRHNLKCVRNFIEFYYY